MNGKVDITVTVLEWKVKPEPQFRYECVCDCVAVDMKALAADLGRSFLTDFLKDVQLLRGMGNSEGKLSVIKDNTLRQPTADFTD